MRSKKRAPWVPALIRPPDPFASLQAWHLIAPNWMYWRPGCASVIPIWRGWMGCGRSKLGPMPGSCLPCGGARARLIG